LEFLIVRRRHWAPLRPPPPTEYPLELQTYNSALSSTKNQIFRLDGDSIIQEGGLPCLNTNSTAPADACPDPPPQFVVQVQNARGANWSPLVAGLRNLADSEFWDFNAIDGSHKDPTSGFVHVATNSALWNALCNTSLGDGGDLCSDFKAGWGSVIVVDSNSPSDCTPDVGPCIDLTDYHPLVLPAGVTLRGNRRGTNFGPQLHSNNLVKNPFSSFCGYCMIEIRGDYVRVTGLRLRGDSRSTNTAAPETIGVQVDAPGSPGVPLYDVATTTQFIAIIDHNDASDWQGEAVDVAGPFYFDHKTSACMTQINGLNGTDAQNLPGLFNWSQPCENVVFDPSTPGKIVYIVDNAATLANVRVERNFLHHNEAAKDGYGVNLGAAGRAVILGNTFLMNRHAIASDGETHSEYRARYNLKLTDVPNYSSVFAEGQQDFDMHGTFGGYGNCLLCYDVPAGYSLDIAGNTFLGNLPNNFNFEIRGHPVSTIFFRDNVTMREQDGGGGGVIAFNGVGAPDLTFLFQRLPEVAQTPVTVAPDPHMSQVLDYNNQFGNSSPGCTDPSIRFGAASLGVGDFDHDGIDDLFLATGVAWYYSPGGAREWRFLRAATDTIDQLLLGDFDGDGRTDVVAIHGGQFVISWGGISDWEVLNSDPTGGRLFLLPSAVSAMAVGDFNGDKVADIFYADGQTWWVSYGGNTTFAPVNTSSYQVKDLRFGDFDGDGATDVFGVVSNTWSYSKSATGSWASGYLRPALTDTVDGLFVADFNGDGFADVGTSCGSGCWSISYGGFQDWNNVTGTVGPQVAGVGHFLGQVEADLLSWESYPADWFFLNGDLNLYISIGGRCRSERNRRRSRLRLR